MFVLKTPTFGLLVHLSKAELLKSHYVKSVASWSKAFGFKYIKIMQTVIILLEQKIQQQQQQQQKKHIRYFSETDHVRIGNCH